MPIYTGDGERFGLSIGSGGQDDRPAVEVTETEEPGPDGRVANPVTRGVAAEATDRTARARQAAQGGQTARREPQQVSPAPAPLDFGRGAGIGDGFGLEIWEFEERQEEARRRGRGRRTFGREALGQGLEVSSRRARRRAYRAKRGRERSGRRGR